MTAKIRKAIVIRTFSNQFFCEVSELLISDNAKGVFSWVTEIFLDPFCFGADPCDIISQGKVSSVVIWKSVEELNKV